MLDLTAEKKKLQKNALRYALRASSNLDFAPFHLWLGLGFLGKNIFAYFLQTIPKDTSSSIKTCKSKEVQL